jgi:hypothetical protein
MDSKFFLRKFKNIKVILKFIQWGSRVEFERSTIRPLACNHVS